jgi:NADPH:quinone reductase-like Zn-dependent oxidoreductase
VRSALSTTCSTAISVRWGYAFGQTLRPMADSENARYLVALTELVESGAVTPAIDPTYPLSETPAAIRHLVEGRAHGKTVITI